MTLLYVIPDAQPREPDQIHQSLSVWVGSLADSLIGILTDPPGRHGCVVAREVVLMLHTATIQKCLIDDDVAAISGLQPKEVGLVHEEVTPMDYSVGLLTVDGNSLKVDTLTYRGLDFALGHDLAHPFAVFRPTGSHLDWPQLITRFEDDA